MSTARAARGGLGSADTEGDWLRDQGSPKTIPLAVLAVLIVNLLKLRWRFWTKAKAGALPADLIG